MSTSSQLSPYKADFLKAAIDGGVLSFGQFELKSKRISPYFFNAGKFYRAVLLRAISTAFAKAIIEADQELDFDIVFGPAYKGIPLATSTVDKLAQLAPEKYEQLCYSFDRKEPKDHGEGGNIVGAPLKGKRILIVDDVITAGTASREAINKIEAEGGIVAGIVVALDRLEKTPSKTGDDSAPAPSAIGEIRRQYGFPVIAILTLNDIINGVQGTVSAEDIKRMEEYRAKYKATD